MRELKQYYNIENAAIFNEEGTIFASILQDKIDKETFGITMANTYIFAETAMGEARKTAKRVVIESNDGNWIVSKVTSEILLGMAVNEKSKIMENIEDITSKIKTHIN